MEVIMSENIAQVLSIKRQRFVKIAERRVNKILENLKRCHFEPLIVFNGDPESVFANHSLNLSGVFNDARQKINSLIVSLKQG